VALRDVARPIEIEPSLYGADMSRLGEEVAVLLDAGARVFHFDTGDGHFVPPITMGPIVLQWISGTVREAGGWMDCHLMVDEPERHFEAFKAAGADSVTFHFEVVDDAHAIAEQARALGLGVGIAFIPGTEPEAVAEVAAEADVALCMSIMPGYSGQKFMPDAIPRIRRLRELIPESVRIQVDGGIGASNIRDVHEAGATLLVAATSIFGKPDRAAAYRELTEAVA
jgi:ribulose-phosphate 3-epimerase